MYQKVMATLKTVKNTFQRATKTRSAKPVYTTSEIISSMKPINIIGLKMENISLSKFEKIALEQLHKRLYVNTFEFRELGICNAAQIIRQLKLKGAVIDTQLLPCIDSFGNPKVRIGHYRLIGWELSTQAV